MKQIRVILGLMFAAMISGVPAWAQNSDALKAVTEAAKEITEAQQ